MWRLSDILVRELSKHKDTGQLIHSCIDPSTVSIYDLTKDRNKDLLFCYVRLTFRLLNQCTLVCHVNCQTVIYFIQWKLVAHCREWMAAQWSKSYSHSVRSKVLGSIFDEVSDAHCYGVLYLEKETSHVHWFSMVFYIKFVRDVKCENNLLQLHITI